MTHIATRTLTARDGASIFVREWNPSGPVRGAILICHGLGEHSGRYEHVGQRLSRAGYTVWAHDHRGHGQSSGARGALAHSDDLVVDSEMVLAALAKETGQTPFIVGHSMGGPVAGMVGLRGIVPVKGVVLSSPALKTYAGGALVALSGIMAVLAPNRAMSNQLSVDSVARDPAVVEAYKKDPLVHPTITPRLFRWMIASAGELHRAAPTWKTPILVMYAGADKLVDPAGARTFVAALPAGVGASREFPAFYHEIFNDLEKEGPLSEMETWLASRN